MSNRTLVYFINTDWYFNLHWIDRAKAAQKNGYNVIIVTCFNDKAIKEKFEKIGFKCVNLFFNRHSKSPYLNLLSTFKLIGIINKERPDIIHNITVKANLIGGIVAKVMSTPCVCTVPGRGRIYTLDTPLFKVLRYISTHIYQALSSNSFFIFENNDDRNYFINKKVCGEINSKTILGAGVDIQKYRYTDIPDGKPSILFACRLLYSKGLTDLIEVSRRLKSEKGLDFTVNVAGIVDKDNDDSIPIEKIEEWHNNGDINWLGQRSDMPDLLEKNHIVVLPSNYGEGVPRFLIEAAACGRPCVAYNIIGCKEIVKHGVNGYLAAPGNLDALSQYIETLLTDRELCRVMGAQGRKLVIDKFRQDIVIKETMDVYDQILQIDAPLGGAMPSKVE